jgi:signal transduction histidine kinase
MPADHTAQFLLQQLARDDDEATFIVARKSCCRPVILYEREGDGDRLLERLKQQLQEALQSNRLLQEELAATNRGLLALTMEIEKKNEEVKAITQQLWQMARMATMGELAASLAHELNNPLTTVSLLVESLTAQIPSDDPQQRALQVIAREVDRMAALVKSLLDFSRRSPLQVAIVDICREIEHTLDLMQHDYRKKGVSVRRDYQAGLPPLYADRQELQQLFLNLFINAGDAMPQGGTLTVRVYAVDTAHITIDIADTGIGIRPDDLPLVMEPFFTTKPEGKGTGLGLSICRRIVQEHHGGKISIASEVDRGTTVSLKLPVRMDVERQASDVGKMEAGSQIPK